MTSKPQPPTATPDYTTDKLPTEIPDCITDPKKPCVLRNPKCSKFEYSQDFLKWKKDCADRVDPPAIHTRSLAFHHADNRIDEKVDWIRSFTNVVQLEVMACWHDYGRRPFAPFHGLSSTVKSLSVVWTDLPSRDVFDFICSFPHLVDLHVAGEGRIRNSEDWAISPLPPSTRSIVLGTLTSDFVRQLLEQPNNLHFTKIARQRIFQKPFEGVADLVERCSHVLECIDIDFGTSAEPFPSTPAITSVSIHRKLY